MAAQHVGGAQRVRPGAEEFDGVRGALDLRGVGLGVDHRRDATLRGNG
ncbi:MAG: hypothetical protein IPN17_00805 [Deltaproteobacteria bacterium]|nr:hypothetical protein [Deltaproteobacteria bacterium]